MTRKEVISWLNDAETRFPVEQWSIGDISVWPTVKKELFFKWIQADKESAGSKQYIKAAKPKRNKLVKILIELTALLSSVYSFIKLLAMPKRDIPVLFVEKNTYRTNLDGQAINRHYEPVIGYIKEEFGKESLLINVDAKDDSINYKDADKLLFLENYTGLVNLRTKLKKEKLQVHLPGFETFLTEFDALVSGLIKVDKYQQALYKQVQQIKGYAYIYDILLRKFNSRVAILLGYYTVQRYAMIYAARKLNVVSIDLQHGSQGPLHVSYSNFNNVPKGGYNLLPDIFWCWDEASANFIAKWTANQDFHKVIVGGNAWVEHNSATSGSHLVFPSKKIIIYTMQMDVPEDYIIKAIKNSDADYEWWFRFHPRTSAAVKEQIGSLLTENNITDRVNIIEANEYPLPAILNKAVIHISKSSGSIIEGVQLGVHTIIIDELGVTKFEDYVNEGEAVAFLSADAGEFLQLIIELGGTTSVNSGLKQIKYKSTVDELLGRKKEKQAVIV
jgi:hypothetical protein